LIDLHLHTTASDGTLAPASLVARAARAGLTVIAITDHDTTAGIAAARSACVSHGLQLVTGIEITAVEEGRDVHVLGYFIDPGSPRLRDFLAAQRADRLRRVRTMGELLGRLGCRVDVEALLAAQGAGERSIGRPALADALVAAGHARDRDDAFGRLLGAGCPAFVPRTGLSAADVVATIHEAGGLASLAHPGITRMDHLVPPLAAGGLDALEARHSDHPPETEAHYRSLASRHGLLVSGGSDFHGDNVHRNVQIGVLGLDARDFEALRARAGARAS
jgi:predicted metal-dependent phosphoesterase TrpH